MTELMTTAEAAKVVDLTPAAIRTAARQGRLKVAQTTSSGVRLFARRDVLRFKTHREGRQSSQLSEAGA